MTRLLACLLLTNVFFCTWAFELSAFEFDQDYLYYRDANVPPFQKSREFFDMPDRPGRYEVTMVSENIGPLTFRVVRAVGEQEKTMVQQRSYQIGNHEFQMIFDNPTGKNDLIVEIANSNPTGTAKVSVFVVELTNHE